ncbi:hypothetical protein SLA2020_285530 [Shorea laevis]
MGRFGGRGGGGGGRSGGGFHTSSGLTSKNRKDGELRRVVLLLIVDQHFGLGGHLLVRQWIVGNFMFYIISVWFEGPCDKYKSRWSRWWTKEDEKTYCKDWSKVYEKNCLNSENPESYCSDMGELTRRVCRGVKLN